MSQIEQQPPMGRGSDLKWLELVVKRVNSLRYGVVEIVVHDSRVVLLGKTERVRLDKTEHRTE
jgi:hypothetical protein